MKQILNFDGQEVTLTNEGFLFVYIDETFHSAGSKYGWIGTKEGISLNKKIIDFAVKEYATIVIGIRNHPYPYYIDAIDWKIFSEQTKSFYKTNNLILYVMQLSKLKINKPNEIETYTQTKI